MVQTAPNTLRNSIQVGFWGPFTASQRVFRVLGRFLFLRSSDPATLYSMFFGPKRVAGGVVWVRKRDTGAEAR